jgi:tRNA U54 and U55 pseudouridine synthase Pus10
MKLILELPKIQEQTETERRAYCADIFAVFPRLEKDIKAKMFEQLISTYSTGIATSRTREDRDYEILRGNGIMEGMAALLELWKEASDEHVTKSTPEENFDKHKPLGEV